MQTKEVRHRSPEELPEISGQPDGNNRRGRGDRKSRARQNKWKRDRDEAVADAVWQNEKEERDRVCRIALAHTAAID